MRSTSVCLPGCQRVISLWDSDIRKKVRPAEEEGADLASASLQITAQSSSSSTSCRSLPFVRNSVVGHDHKRRLVVRLLHPSIHPCASKSLASSLMLDRQRDRPMKKASHVASDPVNGNPLAPFLLTAATDDGDADDDLVAVQAQHNSARFLWHLWGRTEKGREGSCAAFAADGANTFDCARARS